MKIFVKETVDNWTPPTIPESIPHGDMPGDKVEISENQIRKATVIFPELLKRLSALEKDKAVVAVSGGSGVGKSEIASLLCWFFHEMGVEAYTLSGDNYPRRIPAQNDAERERIFRVGGLQGLLKADEYSDAVAATLKALWISELDADPALCGQYPWLAVYQAAGRVSLAEYLGTDQEQNFEEISAVLAAFHEGKEHIWLKRMGRRPEELYYEKHDFSKTQVLLIDWTHGNSAYLKGVDIPILLNSTPQETREHRRNRKRDGKTDSAFTTTVLELEQQKIHQRADIAQIILSKNGELWTHEDYHRVMGE